MTILTIKKHNARLIMVRKKKKNRIKVDHAFLIALGCIVLIIILPLTIGFIQKQQQIQQNAASSQPTPNGPTGNWDLVWNDEFNDSAGMSGPNNSLAASKWNSGWQTGPTSPGFGSTKEVTAPVSSQETEYFGPAGILFPGDDAVHLRLQNGIDNGGNFGGKSVESGMITTAGLMALNPANVSVANNLQPYTINGTTVLEIRARIPGPNSDAGKYWPVWWLTNAGNYGSGGNPSGNVWPGGTQYSEEIDLAEWYDSGATGATGDFHLHAASEFGGMSSLPSSLRNTDVSLAYHTYTYEFSSKAINIWVDGLPVSGVNPSASQVQAQWKYPQYLMLAFQAYPGATKPTSTSGQPTDMMIDYVRVWQQCTTACPTASPSISQPAPTDITPTYSCFSGQPCTTLSPSPSTTVSTTPIPTTSTAPSSSPSISPSTSPNPSVNPSISPTGTPGHGGHGGNFWRYILQIILLILKLLEQLFGHH